VIRTALTELLGIRYPVVQAAMGYVSGPRLAAAVSDAGGLGLIASATMSLAELEKAIEETAGRTAGPFGVNLRADAPDAAGVFVAKRRQQAGCHRDGGRVGIAVKSQSPPSTQAPSDSNLNGNWSVHNTSSIRELVRC
jgi:NAD(P)H-dependent flavin oxidoreductase YrpB (nitropropane dioxygenase family)